MRSRMSRTSKTGTHALPALVRRRVLTCHSGAEISWASHVTIGQVELPERGVKPGRVAVILEMDLLTFAISGPPSSLGFIDVPLSNIAEVKIEGRRLKSSGDGSTQTACQLSIQLREGHYTHSVNGKQRSAETVAVMFAEPDQAKELLVQIKAQLESHRVADVQQTSPEANLSTGVIRRGQPKTTKSIHQH